MRVSAKSAATKLNKITMLVSRSGTCPPIIPKLVKLPEAMIVGIDINIEIRAASFRVKPAHKAPVIVIPDREVPGMRAIACHSPHFNASGHVKDFNSRCCVVR